MANFVLSLHSSPSDVCTLQALYRFSQSVIAAGHQISCIFLYQDGVYHACDNFDVSNDEFNPENIWSRIFDLNIDVQVCITAAGKRGIAIDDSSAFNVSGLAEFAMLTSAADKWVQFK
ncbi:sulfurtransferase complex subunit TusD [Pseudoalteromonas sp. SSDWG2]|uniref:sulfurtransferase complex subunit TusD n=1 Tax=Pseudoalteromonas sp. SSDWG2 TaxID=3139391 RepID=UPI003BAD9D5A